MFVSKCQNYIENKPQLLFSSTGTNGQGQMAITDSKWCEFCVWTLRGHSVERIPFDNATWLTMLSKLNNFYIKAVIPELFSEQVRCRKALK